MNEYWAGLYQNYQDGLPFRGRAVFGAIARLASVGYRLGYVIRRWAVKPRAAFRPRAKVIGVGNLTVGGSGKTSLVDYLASRLVHARRRVIILTRGYGRQSTDRVLISPGRATDYTAAEAGDEPLMLARRNPETAVIVDADRAAAARDFEQHAATDVFLLDDALQYQGLVLDTKIVTVLDGELREPYRLFPAGRWREPPERVRDVDAVVLLKNRQDADVHADELQLRALGFAGPIFPFAYELVSWRTVDHQPCGFLTLPENSRIGVFCALARPRRFLAWLGGQGLAAENVRSFADHFMYRQEDFDQLVGWARSAALDYLVTTEKDAVKLTRFATGGVRIIFPEVRLTPCGQSMEFDRFVEKIFECG